MFEYRDYDKLFPELVYDIVDYFRINNRIKEPKNKSVIDYCAHSRFNDSYLNGEIIQPGVVSTICDVLVKKRVLTCIRIGTTGIDANYLFMPKDEVSFQQNKPYFVFLLNCIAYGFRYIYTAYSEKVLPIVVKKNDELTMGTCFRFHDGIVTAKHCVEADEVSIPGYSNERLRHFGTFVSKDPEIDLAYIELRDPSGLTSGIAHVLDDVLVMGYPKIPMFFDFCAGERANISSISTRGSIASLAEQYISRNAGQLMLVTARIRGGNSGGPIINTEGAVVGVAFSEPSAEGDYDDMGYGVAYPISVLFELLKDPMAISVNYVDRIIN